MKTLKCVVMPLLIAFAVGCAGYYEEEKRTPGEFVDDTLISTTVKRLLISDPEIKGMRIKVRVRQGEVTFVNHAGTEFRRWSVPKHASGP